MKVSPVPRVTIDLTSSARRSFIKAAAVDGGWAGWSV